jgi:hypothetical protein
MYKWKNVLCRFSKNAPNIFRVETYDVPIDRRTDITIYLGLYGILFQSTQRKQSTFSPLNRCLIRESRQQKIKYDPHFDCIILFTCCTEHILEPIKTIIKVT